MNPAAERTLNPRSVAIIGASDNPHKVGGRPIFFMTRHGYSGRIYPVNPARATVQGLPCYPSLEALPEVPEAVVVAIDGSKAIEAVRQSAALGVPTAVVITAGFSELGEAGAQAQREMVAEANAHGMRIIGPNALGVSNFGTGAILSFSTMFTDVEPKDGPIALVGQSGASCVMPYAFLREAGLGARYLVGSGNDADLGVAELVRMVASDPYIKLILCYIETMRNPEMLAEAADIARQRGASIILLRGGSSARGAIAAASHTGAMAGSDVALDAFLRRHGIWRAHDMHEMVNAAPLYLAGLDPRAGRTVVMSHSGGLGVMCADVASRVGLPLAEFAAPTRSGLDAILPAFATAANPLDLTAALLGNRSMFADALDIVGKDPQSDMFLIGIPVAGPGYDIPALASTALEFSAREQRPLVASAPQDYVRAEFRRQGGAVYRNETDALGALRQYWAHVELNKRTTPASHPAPPAAAAVPLHGALDEATSLEWLRANGLPVVDFRRCADAAAAVRAHAEFGGSVVVKGCAAEISHKSEHGLVHLNLADGDAVRAAASACLAKLEALGCASPQVLVAPMVKGLFELVLGASVDPVFGPLVMIGEGGKLVEVRADVVSLLAPFAEDDVLRAVRGLRIARLLDGYRDQPPLDIAAVARAAVALGNLASAHRAGLRSIDMNPLLVMADGHGALAVDAVVEFKVQA